MKYWTQDFLGKLLLFQPEMIPAQWVLWEIVFLRGMWKIQILKYLRAQIWNIWEHPLYEICEYAAFKCNNFGKHCAIPNQQQETLYMELTLKLLLVLWRQMLNTTFWPHYWNAFFWNWSHSGHKFAIYCKNQGRWSVDLFQNISLVDKSYSQEIKTNKIAEFYDYWSASYV